MREDVGMVKEENFKKPYSYREPAPREYKIVWIMVSYMVYVHIAALYGLYLGITRALWTTLLFTFMMLILSNLGITAGAHRLWTHKTYKAKIPLETFLMMCHSSSNSLTTITWIRNHMLHHKHTDTDADPHNSTRGFFYCHIGWLLVKKHPEARAKGKEIDLTELYANPVLRFQQKHAFWLVPSIAFFIPSVVPLIWNEAFTVAYHLNLLRVTITLNSALMVNSVAHMWGTRPYDKNILPVQNKIVSFFAFGEGFHNYHHVFPQDYRTAELGDNYLNLTTKFIDFCAWIGQAYDLKYVTDDVIAARATRTGDRSKGNY